MLGRPRRVRSWDCAPPADSSGARHDARPLQGRRAEAKWRVGCPGLSCALPIFGLGEGWRSFQEKQVGGWEVCIIYIMCASHHVAHPQAPGPGVIAQKDTGPARVPTVGKSALHSPVVVLLEVLKLPVA